MTRAVAPRGIFVTGTDTEVGKTLAATVLMHHYCRQGLRVVGMKPVAAGCHETPAGWKNEDVEALLAASNVEAPIEAVNPYAFREPIAPHIAAKREGRTIDLGRIVAGFETLRALADMVVVEGAGGFLVPLNDTEDFGDLAQRLDLPVVLTVGLRLGCINHALLTQEAIAARGLRLAGWIANRIDPHMSAPAENIDALMARLRAPLLGVIPFLETVDAASVVLTRGVDFSQRADTSPEV